MIIIYIKELPKMQIDKQTEQYPQINPLQNIQLRDIVFHSNISSRLSAIFIENSHKQFYFQMILRTYKQQKPTDDEWGQLFLSIASINQQKVRLHQLHLPCILQISNHITFSKLKYLDLSYNGIVSIQNLPFLNVPQLKFLFLDDNPITIGKPLSKTSFPYLNTLHIKRQQEQLYKGDDSLDSWLKNISFSRMTTSDHIEFFTFSQKDRYGTGINEDASLFCKLQADKADEITFHSNQGIRQQAVYRSIQRKYPKIILKGHCQLQS